MSIEFPWEHVKLRNEFAEKISIPWSTGVELRPRLYASRAIAAPAHLITRLTQFVLFAVFDCRPERLGTGCRQCFSSPTPAALEVCPF